MNDPSNRPQEAIDAELLQPLLRCFEWLASLRDGAGRVICPDHRIEHTGKSACLCIGAVELFRHTGDSKWLDLARQQSRRLLTRLEREGSSPCFTFRPGRHDPFNCSNSVIDGGACADALSHLVLEFGHLLEEQERTTYAEAALLHARTYLRYAVLDKGIPAQRAWGLTGLAGAFALSKDESLAQAGIEAVGVLEAIQHADGSYPYHPLEWGGAHPGAADISCFYQSRNTGFLIFSLERLGRDPRHPLFRGPLQRGLEFLEHLVGPDGIKPGLAEAKPWYWGAEYEVASHAFDVYALVRGNQLFEPGRSGASALAAYRAWCEHLDGSGRPQSHLAGPGRGRSYQCPLFWAAHACWIARALPGLQSLRTAEAHSARADAARAASIQTPAAQTSAAQTQARRYPRSIDLRVTFFEQAQIARLEDAHLVAFVRGARPKGNLNHGSPMGAGLLRAIRKADGLPLIQRQAWRADQEGEWSARSGGTQWRRGWRNGSSELRFGFWLSRVEWRAGRFGAAMSRLPRLLRQGVWNVASSEVSSAFDRDARLTVLPDGVLIESSLAFRDGARVAGSSLQRRFRIEGDGLLVEERMLSRGALRGLQFHFPKAASQGELLPDGARYRL